MNQRNRQIVIPYLICFKPLKVVLIQGDKVVIFAAILSWEGQLSEIQLFFGSSSYWVLLFNVNVKRGICLGSGTRCKVKVLFICLHGVNLCVCDLLQRTVFWGSGSCWTTQMTRARGLKVTWKSASSWSGQETSLRYDYSSRMTESLPLSSCKYSGRASLFCFMNSFLFSPCDTMQEEKRDSNDDQDDIESNLLLPAGVTLRWATLSLKVFRAEDVPQSKTYFRCVTKHFKVKSCGSWTKNKHLLSNFPHFFLSIHHLGISKFVSRKYTSCILFYSIPLVLQKKM